MAVTCAPGLRFLKPQHDADGSDRADAALISRKDCPCHPAALWLRAAN
jgi:hypothetical protein